VGRAGGDRTGEWTMRWVSFAILVAVVLVLQTTLVPRLSIRGIFPDLLLIVALYYALQAPEAPAMLAGWICGLMMDLSAGGRVGVLAFAFGLVGVLVVKIRDLTFRDNPLLQMFVALVAGSIVHGIERGQRVLWGEAAAGMGDALLTGVFVAMYTAALTPYVHWLLSRARGLLLLPLRTARTRR